MVWAAHWHGLLALLECCTASAMRSASQAEGERLCRSLGWSSPGAMLSFPGAGGSSSGFSTFPSRPCFQLHAMAMHPLAMSMGAECTLLSSTDGTHAHQMGRTIPAHCLPSQLCFSRLHLPGIRRTNLLVCTTALPSPACFIV